MELDVTALVNDNRIYEYSGSICTLGENAAQLTWDNALNSDVALLDTPEKIDAARAHFKEYGAWDDLDYWPANELNALMIQDVSACLQGYLEAKHAGELEHYEETEGGRVCEHEGRFYFYLGI